MDITPETRAKIDNLNEGERQSIIGMLLCQEGIREPRRSPGSTISHYSSDDAGEELRLNWAANIMLGIEEEARQIIEEQAEHEAAAARAAEAANRSSAPPTGAAQQANGAAGSGITMLPTIAASPRVVRSDTSPSLFTSLTGTTDSTEGSTVATSTSSVVYSSTGPLTASTSVTGKRNGAVKRSAEAITDHEEEAVQRPRKRTRPAARAKAAPKPKAATTKASSSAPARPRQSTVGTVHHVPVGSCTTYEDDVARLEREAAANPDAARARRTRRTVQRG